MFHDIDKDRLACKFTLRFNGTQCGDTTVDIDEFTHNYQDLHIATIKDYLTISFVNIPS